MGVVCRHAERSTLEPGKENLNHRIAY